jgi:hypothetical protein
LTAAIIQEIEPSFWKQHADQAFTDRVRRAAEIQSSQRTINRPETSQPLVVRLIVKIDTQTGFEPLSYESSDPLLDEHI